MLYHGITPRFLVAVAFSKTKARANKISTFFKAIVSMLIREREREKREREREREREGWRKALGSNTQGKYLGGNFFN